MKVFREIPKRKYKENGVYLVTDGPAGAPKTKVILFKAGNDWMIDLNWTGKTFHKPMMLLGDRMVCLEDK